ncbi:outer membrane beta-barrel protein [Thalassobellus citreus]|uniref:outer membrane beta-barrel protein n=1 Tax=Thalassobellus citreus TaxID=3367752 RepID=UPI003795E7E8
MKNKLIIALLLVGSTVFAQNTEEKFEIPKNQWTLGGNVSFNSRSSEYENNSVNSINKYENKAKGFGIKPEVGYAISNNLILGLGVGYLYSEYENINSEEYQTKTYRVTPYVRKYFPLNERFAFNIQGELSFSDSERKTKEEGSTNFSSIGKGNDFFVGLRPGITYSLSHKIYLNATMGTLGFTNSKWESDSSKDKTDVFDFNLGTSNLAFGLLILI